MTEIVGVATPVGPGRFFIDAADRARATLVLGHGAGGGVDAYDLAALARSLPAAGVTVIRFEQPWRTAGKKAAVAAPRLDEGWRAAVDALLAVHDTGGRLLFGGRSSGARVACRTAPDYPVVGVVALAFPLHPPGRPDRSRAAELATPAVPRLVFQGERDPFGSPEDVATAVGDPDVEIVAIPDGDHSLKVRQGSTFNNAAARELIVTRVRDFCLGGE